MMTPKQLRSFIKRARPDNDHGIYVVTTNGFYCVNGFHIAETGDLAGALVLDTEQFRVDENGVTIFTAGRLA